MQFCVDYSAYLVFFFLKGKERKFDLKKLSTKSNIQIFSKEADNTSSFKIYLFFQFSYDHWQRLSQKGSLQTPSSSYPSKSQKNNFFKEDFVYERLPICTDDDDRWDWIKWCCSTSRHHVCFPQAQTNQWVLTAFFAVFHSRFFLGAFFFLFNKK